MADPPDDPLALRSRPYDRRVPIGDDSYATAFARNQFERGDIAALFHENTKFDGVVDRRIQQTYDDLASTLESINESINPDYPGLERIDLPTDVSMDADLGTALFDRQSVREFAGEPISTRELSRLLFYGAGCSRPEEDVPKRTYPSPGALYPTEPYLFVLRGEDLDPGLYYYNAQAHALRVIERRDRDELVAALEDAFLASVGQLPSISELSLVVALSGAFGRLKFKYGPRGYRYVLLECGHLAQNLLLLAAGLGLGGIPYAGFRDDQLNDLIGIDGVDEGVVYTLFFGHTHE